MLPVHFHTNSHSCQANTKQVTAIAEKYLLPLRAGDTKISEIAIRRMHLSLYTLVYFELEKLHLPFLFLVRVANNFVQYTPRIIPGFDGSDCVNKAEWDLIRN